MGGMKSLLIALFVALLMVGCGEEAQKEAVDFSKLKDRNGIMYLLNEETPFTGRAESFYENGQKGVEVNLKDGKPHGLTTTWYENGQKEREANLKDGKLEGLWTFWHEDGTEK